MGKKILMAGILCCLWMLGAKVSVYAAETYTVQSPNKEISLKFVTEDNGGIHYSVEHLGKEVIETSALGIETDIGDFREGMFLSDVQETQVSEKFQAFTGKKSEIDLVWTSAVFTFQKESAEMKIEIRVYDDGIAYRYIIPGNGNVSVKSEITEFNFPDGSGGWGFEWRNDYEGEYKYQPPERLGNGNFAMPLLMSIENNRDWVLLSEANVYNAGGSYCTSHLQGTSGQSMKVVFAPEQTEDIQTELPMQTPYRVAIISDDLNTLINSDIIAGLNPENELSDTGWIKPGKAAWSWWSEERSPQWYLRQKDYIDFAAQNGWEYVTIDAGWDETWVADLCEYGAQKDVGILIWTDVGAIDTKEKAEEKLSLWASWGIKGIKVDFMMNDSQKRMETYEIISRQAEKLKLLVNFHGSAKPSGENRTWPQVITSEAVRGSEHYKWDSYGNAYHNCVLPFTRNVIGSMDFTPVILSSDRLNTTFAHQLALSIVYESGIQHFADSIDVYENWIGLPFLNRVPVSWDETRLLEGFPGDYAVIARRSGEDWFIGGITNQEKSSKISLDFLGEGNYTAYIYKDGKQKEFIDVDSCSVDKTSILDFDMKKTGGCAVYITQGAFDPYEKYEDGYIYYEAENGILEGNAEKRACQNASEGYKVGNIGGEGQGMATFEAIEVAEEGWYELKVVYFSGEDRDLELWVNGKAVGKINTVNSGSYDTARSIKTKVYLQKGENTIRFGNIDGYAPDLDKIGLKKAETFETEVYEAEDESNTISQGSIIGENSLCSGGKKVGYLGMGESLQFNGVKAETAGKYILRIYYLTGDNRNVSIKVNGEETYTVNCFDSGGFDRLEYKEVLIELAEGDNTLLLYNGEEYCPDIDKIEIERIAS